VSQYKGSSGLQFTFHPLLFRRLPETPGSRAWSRVAALCLLVRGTVSRMAPIVQTCSVGSRDVDLTSVDMTAEIT